MTPILLVVGRSVDKSGRSVDKHGRPINPGTFSVRIGGEGGRLILASARVPFFGGARALLAEGVDPDTPLSLRHAGNSIISMRSTVGHAAQWTVEENDNNGGTPRIRRYRAFEPETASDLELAA